MASIITDIGMTKLASATPQDQLEITHIAVGDGGGPTPPPLDPAATSLTNEVWRGSSSAPITSVNNPTTLTFEAFIPESDGGFTIREIAIFDSEGDMIAIGETPVVQKPAAGSDTALSLAVRMNLTVTDEATISLIYQDNAFIDHQGLGNRSANGAHPASSISTLAIPNIFNNPSDVQAILALLTDVAISEKQSSQTDSTAGRLLTPGAFGLGNYLAVSDANSAVKSGFYSLPVSLGAANSPDPTSSGALIVTEGGPNAGYLTQIWIKCSDTAGYSMAYRAYSGDPLAWGAWQFVWDSGNLSAASQAEAEAGVNNAKFMTALRVSQFVSAYVNSSNEMVGAIMPFATTVAPNGWIKANGAAVSRTTYADLFAKVGTFWGSGDGSTTFNVPDLRGEFLRCWDDGAGIDSGRYFGTNQDGTSIRVSNPGIIVAITGWDSLLNYGPTPEADGYLTDSTQYSSNQITLRPRNVALLYYIKY